MCEHKSESPSEMSAIKPTPVVSVTSRLIVSNSDVGVPEFMRVRLSPELQLRLQHLHHAMEALEADELHVWNVADLELLDELDPIDREAQAELVSVGDEQLVLVKLAITEGEYERVHACVFADGEVSFYTRHTASGAMISASSPFMLKA